MKDIKTDAMTPTKSNIDKLEQKKDTLQPPPQVTKEDIYFKCNSLKKKFEDITINDSVKIENFITRDFVPLLKDLMASKLLTNIKNNLEQFKLVLMHFRNEVIKEGNGDYSKLKIITERQLNALDEIVKNVFIKKPESRKSSETPKSTKLSISKEIPSIKEEPFYEQKGKIFFINPDPNQATRLNYYFVANGTMNKNISIINIGTYWVVDPRGYGQGKGTIKTKGDVVNYIFQVRIRDFGEERKIFIGSCIYQKGYTANKLSFLNGIMSIFKGESDENLNYETQEWKVKEY